MPQSAGLPPGCSEATAGLVSVGMLGHGACVAEDELSLPSALQPAAQAGPMGLVESPVVVEPAAMVTAVGSARVGADELLRHVAQTRARAARASAARASVSFRRRPCQ